MYTVKLVDPELEGKETGPKTFSLLPDARAHARNCVDVKRMAERAEIFDATGKFCEAIYRRATPEEKRERAKSFLRHLRHLIDATPKMRRRL